jgi:hypothetical protein
MNVLLKFEEARPTSVRHLIIRIVFVIHTWISSCIGQLLHGGIIKIQKRRSSVFFEMFYL